MSLNGHHGTPTAVDALSRKPWSIGLAESLSAAINQHSVARRGGGCEGAAV